MAAFSLRHPLPHKTKQAELYFTNVPSYYFVTFHRQSGVWICDSFPGHHGFEDLLSLILDFQGVEHNPYVAFFINESIHEM